MTIPKGAHDMFLRVYEKDNELNKKTLRFYVYNQEENNILQSLSPDLSQLPPQGEMKLQDEEVNIGIKLQ